MSDDTGAAPDEILARVLEDVNIPTAAQEEIGGEKPAERTADYQRAGDFAPVMFGLTGAMLCAVCGPPED